MIATVLVVEPGQYRSWAVDHSTPTRALQWLKKLDHYHCLCEQGVSQALALDIIERFRVTYYRW